MQDYPETAAPLSPSGFPPFMRTKEVAERLHLKPKTLAEFRITGQGPEFIKAGPRLCIYTAAAVEAWLEKGRRSSTSEQWPREPRLFLADQSAHAA